MLDMARKYLERTLAAVKPFVDAGMYVVVLEPSCCSVFRDELPNLMPGRSEAKRLQHQTVLLSEFLAQHADLQRLPKLARKAVVQGHCHHKSVLDFSQETRVMDAIGLDYDVLDSSCCGMAGSFGFEKDKFDVAQACGERVLLPRARAAAPSTVIVADGFSCRTQIEENTGRHALHLSQVLALALEGEQMASASARAPVETAIVRARRAAIGRSKSRAATGILLAALSLTASVLLWWRRR
jgi:Fe-S oxidoreductase